jgi:hypothetical protein
MLQPTATAVLLTHDNNPDPLGRSRRARHVSVAVTVALLTASRVGPRP